METENEWTLFEDKLPKLGELIEVRDCNDQEINECRLLLNKSSTGCFELSYKNDIKDYSFNPYYYNQWRYKKEKSPDFSKLNVGDFIVFTYGEEKQRMGGYIIRSNLTNHYLKISIEKNEKDYEILTGFLFSIISRIQRINFEDNKIEEI